MKPIFVPVTAQKRRVVSRDYEYYQQSVVVNVNSIRYFTFNDYNDDLQSFTLTLFFGGDHKIEIAETEKEFLELIKKATEEN